MKYRKLYVEIELFGILKLKTYLDALYLLFILKSGILELKWWKTLVEK